MPEQPQQEQWLLVASNLAKLGFVLAALFGIADMVLTERDRSASNPNGAPGTPAHVDGAQSDDPPAILEGSVDRKGIHIVTRTLAAAFLGASILVLPAAALANRISKRSRKTHASEADVPEQGSKGVKK